MAILRFIGLTLEDFEQLAVKDPDTRYLVFNSDGTVYGEYIGDKLIGTRPIDLESRVEDLELEAERLDDEVIRVEQELDAHIEDEGNPHGVTAEQVGTYDKAAIDNKAADTLQAAKDYTYSKTEIDNKDTVVLQEAKDYTDILSTDVLELQDRVEVVEDKIEDIEDGTTVVKKAEQDEDGNNIKDTYATVAYVDSELETALLDYVEKEAGKGLSTNDYTDADKQSVEKIPAIEQDIVDLENEVDYIKDNYVTNTTLDLQLLEKQSIRPNGTDLLVIDGKINGVYIDSLYVTDIETVDTVAEMLALPDMKRGDIVIVVETESTYILVQEPSNVLDNWAQFLSKPEVISVNGKTGIVHIGISDIDNLQGILNSKLNVVTYENDKVILEQSIVDLENNKVDKVAGKGLSTNDYTNTDKNKVDSIDQVYTSAEKSKLAGIEEGAQKNVQADWNAVDGDAFIKNKPTIPTRTSELINDSDFATNASVDSKIDSIPKITKVSELENDSGYQTEAQVDAKVANSVEITWQELKNLRDSSALVPGRKYRIIDYVTTTVQADTRSAGHQFDVIVTALDEKTVSENASACLHEGDTYFANSRLEAWKLKYCLDNDTDRFAWADEVNGKGVIYRMIDEFNNDVPYDFKNIQFKRDDVYYFTFTWITEDDTIWDASIHPELTNDEGEGSRVFDNVILSSRDYLRMLNDSVFIADYDTDGGFFYGWYHNVVKGYFVGNTIGDSFYSNTIEGDFYNNTIGDYFNNNTIGYGFSSNTVGNGFRNNIIGNGFRNNIVGSSFHDNAIGNDCYNNTIGNSFGNNAIGNVFNNNTIGNSFNSNTVGNSFTRNTIGDYFYYNTVGNNVQFIQFSLDGTVSNRIRYIHLKDGLRGASTSNRLDLYFSGLYGRAYPTTFEIIENGNIISSWEATPLTRAGKVKATNTTETWSDTSDGTIYWQGNTPSQLGDIITDMLGQVKNSVRGSAPTEDDLCDVYELRVKAYDDWDTYDGATLIYVPHDEDVRIEFFFNILTVNRSDGTVNGKLLEWSDVLNEKIPNVDTYRFALKKIATDQLYSYDWS